MRHSVWPFENRTSTRVGPLSWTSAVYPAAGELDDSDTWPAAKSRRSTRQRTSSWSPGPRARAVTRSSSWGPSRERCRRGVVVCGRGGVSSTPRSSGTVSGRRRTTRRRGGGRRRHGVHRTLRRRWCAHRTVAPASTGEHEHEHDHDRGDAADRARDRRPSTRARPLEVRAHRVEHDVGIGVGRRVTPEPAAELGVERIDVEVVVHPASIPGSIQLRNAAATGVQVVLHRAFGELHRRRDLADRELLHVEERHRDLLLRRQAAHRRHERVVGQFGRGDRRRRLSRPSARAPGRPRASWRKWSRKRFNAT